MSLPYHIQEQQTRKKPIFPFREFVDNICMVKTDVEGHDLVILRCFSVSYQGRLITKNSLKNFFYTIYGGMNTALLLARSWIFISQLEEFLTEGSGALVSTPSTLGGVVEKLYIGG